jgi:nucleoid-associated protein YgaU
VQPGDTLSGIADSFGIAWGDLYAANTDVIGSDPNLIQPGVVLRVPGTAPAPAPEPTPAPANTYTVRVDDNLWNISGQVYGDPTRWPEIYNANASTIGVDPNLIQPGMVLVIP